MSDNKNSVRNAEIKARCQNLERVRRTLHEKNAEHPGTDHQVDTYFDVDHGRLKLREGDIENYLIHYRRPDAKDPQTSEILLFETEPGTMLKPILTEALGVLGEVVKDREIYYLGNTKIHIDRVRHLGRFLEIEVIDRNNEKTENELMRRCRDVMSELDVSRDKLVDVSYIDLILDA